MTQLHTATMLPVLGLLLASQPAQAHQAAENAGQPAAADPVTQHTDGAARLPVRATDTSADRFGIFNGEQLQISTGTDDDTLTLRAELPTGPSQANSFSLVASAPLHGGDNAMPASLDALANGSKLTLRFGHFGLPTPDPDPVAVGIVADARAACLQAVPEAERAARARCRNDSNFVVHQYGLARYREYLWHTIPAGATDWGFDGTIGINDFEWVDPATRGSHRDRHTDWSVAAHLNHYFAGTAIVASASYQRAYKAAAEQLICPPNPANPATDCVNARGAPPTRTDHFLLSAGFRHRFTGADGTLLNLAVAPEFTFDSLKDVVGVDVPIYFIPGPNGGLTGGIRVGYRSDRDDHFSVSAFVGAAFNLLQ